MRAQYIVCSMLLAAVLTFPAGFPDGTRDPAWYADMLAAKAAAATQYTFDADVEFAGKTGDGPRETVASYRVRVAVAPQNRYLLLVGDRSNLQLVIVSDGVRSWVFDVVKNEYLEIEGFPSPFTSRIDPAVAASKGWQQADPMLIASLILPTLASLASRNASLVDLKTPPDPDLGESEREWPLLTVLSGKSDDRNQRLTQVTFDPDTFKVKHLQTSWSAPEGDQSRFALLTASFTNFELGQAIPASYFVFGPGSARKVETLRFAGVDESSIVGKPAAHFEVLRSDGRSVDSAGIRGQAALLLFSAPGCDACQKQSRTLSELQVEGNGRRISVLEADAANAALHTRFGVRFVPSIVIVDERGIVARFFAGWQNASALRAAMN